MGPSFYLLLLTMCIPQKSSLTGSMIVHSVVYDLGIIDSLSKILFVS